MDAKPDYSLYERSEKIAGWLHKVTALRTIDILNWQREQGIKGGLLEIGVFCGKYFSLLVDDARRTQSPVLGVDTFQFAPKTRVIQEMENLFGGGSQKLFSLWEMPSSQLRPEGVTKVLGRCRFISIDGAHDYENVFRDLILAEECLAHDGIIAADDFLNPLALGVNQAINHFLSRPRAVVPVAYIANKLFLAHRSNEDRYRTAIEKMILNGAEPQSENFRNNLSKGRHHVEQDFHGHKVLLS